ncbi:hypothetical protein FHE74_09245 [Corynebacterium tapiri]|uniref:Uncharacterized protein n=1 Tax=Corynebacterium tapiri TaxID=1448266 RepID=A0A5C4U1V3_9CORY|nr:hypothetical protein FHE74_09245 [Corynebacterium tapiri]
MWLVCTTLPLIALNSCGQPPTPEPTPSSVSSEPSSTTVTTTSPRISTTSEPSPVPAAPTLATDQAATEPYVVECLVGTPGPSLMSDGTTQTTEYCLNQPWAKDYLAAEAAAGLDPSEIPTTVSCPAFLCGYGYDENGNPRPSSGEIQLRHACENGTASPSQCAALEQ